MTRGDRAPGGRHLPPVILVVDDHSETRTLIARTLQPRGYTVVAVADGEAAFAAAALQFPDLVIADIFLPGLSGLSVVDTLRRQDPRLRVIALSAVPDVLERPEVIPAELDLGTMAFLTKPFGLSDLLDLVHQVLPV